jgi:hypothetical protein
MILYFPDFDTLRLAITSGTVPPAVSLKPAVAGFDEHDHVWLQTAEALSRSALAGLQRLGAQVRKTSGAAFSIDVCCWLQALPLERPALPDGVSQQAQQAPVLFELADTAQLSTLVAEMLRLGNDRQSFRWLERGPQTFGLLRVIGPPYYSLLRALDRSGQDAAPRAYVEHAPRVWVEVGHTHPLVGQIKPPRGQFLLLRPPRDWLALEEGPFTDVYDVIEFELPGARVGWQDTALESRLRIPLRLTQGGRLEEAVLWVLRERAVDRLDAFVREADDELLARLIFAVCEHQGEKCIVLRVRPSKQPPPVLALAAEAFRSYLKLPNLYLPCGTQLHPPLRRDAVRKLLADDPDRLTWLYPHGDGTFTPESVPDKAFRPLFDWIDYVLDHDRAALQTWVEAARFDFEPFICKGDLPADKPPGKEPQRGPKDKRKPEEEEAAPPAVPFKVNVKPRRPEARGEPTLEDLPRARPNELQERLKAVEKEFLDTPGPLDAPARRELWPRLAVLNKALRNEGDATVCWVNALWEEHAEAPRWVRTWAHGECLGTGEEVEGEALDRLLAQPHPALAEVRGLAACLACTLSLDRPAPALVERLGTVQRFLEAHEKMLPVRAAWLAWLGLVRLARGDVLSLARARDRVLERLFSQGLSSDLDLPSFLRFSGMRSSDKFRSFRDWLVKLPDRVRFWVELNHTRIGEATVEDTCAYTDLIMAFGLARLGENGEARKLRQRAEEALDRAQARPTAKETERDVHATLLSAFKYRIDQALEGKPATGPLPPELHEYLDKAMDRLARYKVDRLRQKLYILEPHERIDPYRQWTGRFFDDLSRALDALGAVADRERLAEQLRLLLKTNLKEKAGRDRHVQVLQRALELAPRVGEAFALEMLVRVPPALELLEQLVKDGEGTPQMRERAVFLHKAALLEKALFVAAHFNRVEHVQPLVGQFEALLHSQRATQCLKELSSLAGECFRGLRKLGMRDEISRLLRRMAELILKGKDLAAIAYEKDGLAALQTLLHLAAGWYYFGQDDQARPIIDQVRALLYRGQLIPVDQTALACTYVATLGQAPAELALKGIEELFDKLERIRDTYETNSHYSLSQLMVIEALVLSIVTEDFAVGPAARHWLEDDEFLVRRRIHRDVLAVMSQAHL